MGTVNDLGSTLQATGNFWTGTPPSFTTLEQFSRGGRNETLVDCSTGNFYAQNNGALSGGQNSYPVLMQNWQNAVELRGGYTIGMTDGEVTGRMDGTISLTEEWGSLYSKGNSASVFLKNCPAGSVISNWRIDRPWDGIRVAAGTTNWLITECWVSRARDDAVEADQGTPGRIENCLFDETFAGMSFASAGTAGAEGNTVEIDNVLMKMQTYNYQGSPNHGSPFKVSSAAPQILVTNSVIAISKVNHFGHDTRLKTFFEQKLKTGSADNYFLNLTDDALPGTYPSIPAAFTYLSGQTARDYWDDARAEFLAGEEAPPEPEIDANIYQRISVNPATDVVTIDSTEAFVANLTLRADDGVNNANETVTLTVE